MNGVWGVALIIIFLIIIAVVYIFYQRSQNQLLPIDPGTTTVLDPVTQVSLFRGLTPGATEPFATVVPVTSENRFVPIILPNDLPNTITDCNFYGTLINGGFAGACPAGSDFLNPAFGAGQGCYSRPCPNGYTRISSCTCARPGA